MGKEIDRWEEILAGGKIILALEHYKKSTNTIVLHISSTQQHMGEIIIMNHITHQTTTHSDIPIHITIKHTWEHSR